MYIQVAGDGEIYGEGTVIYPQLDNSLQQVQRGGDWTLLPADQTAPNGLIRFRLFPQNHPIITWFVQPTGPGTMYNMFQHQDPNGLWAQVETQCGKTG